jgi:ABC-type antimicrobial peptide transport system permease subunit
VEVVGVVGQVRSASLTEAPTLDVYVPYWQMSLYSNAITLVATATDSASVSGAVRLALRELDPEMPLPAFRTLNEIADASVAPLRFQRNIVVMMAAVALLLASTGIYGVVSHTVAQRTRELGIRRALGAPTGAIERLIVGQVVVPVALGLTVGILAMLPLGGLLRSLIFGVGPVDPPTLGGTAVVLGAVAIAAAYVPARRATRLDPLAALRDE